MVDLSPTEMMCWLYCPVKLPGSRLSVPPNLEQFKPILLMVMADCAERWVESYVYITAKRLFVTPEGLMNRPGWHSDGFMTEDLNYIWCDTSPTVFWEPESCVRFVQDHNLSLIEMEATCEPDTYHHRVYPLKHLLRLDEAVMHKMAPVKQPGFRTFVKVSVSEHEYRLSGNSINHDLAPHWAYVARQEGRNAPEVLETHEQAATSAQAHPALPSQSATAPKATPESAGSNHTKEGME